MPSGRHKRTVNITLVITTTESLFTLNFFENFRESTLHFLEKHLNQVSFVGEVLFNQKRAFGVFNHNLLSCKWYKYGINSMTELTTIVSYRKTSKYILRI